ncbi:MAG: EF-hand domain-containing protein [Pseudomonadota bacterium]
MKKLTIAALVTIVVGSAALTAVAQHQRGLGESMVEAADANQDGNISKDEMLAHRAEKFASADTNGDNLVTAEEFEAFAIAERERKQAERRARMFAKLDADGDGYVTAEEHAAADQRLDRMFERVDTDGDGVITEAEREAAKEKMKNRRGKRGMGRRG